nr:MAG TPA: hypothetical protein [Caudoviricetes sp.]DAX98968.1 MAG TPA: hypothetical protein [Caudoviricetes sp.]
MVIVNNEIIFFVSIIYCSVIIRYDTSEVIL